MKKRHKKYQEQGSTRDIEKCVAKINFGKFERCCLERHRTGEVAGKGINNVFSSFAGTGRQETVKLIR